MPILLDGNNLLHRLPRSRRSRSEVRAEVLDLTRHETMSVTVVFDGPPPAGAPRRENLGRVTVVYSGRRTADDVIVELLPSDASATQWTVVTDDRGLATRARELGARVRSLARWSAKERRTPRRSPPEPRLSSREVAEWEAYFADQEETETID